MVDSNVLADFKEKILREADILNIGAGVQFLNLKGGEITEVVHRSECEHIREILTKACENEENVASIYDLAVSLDDQTDALFAEYNQKSGTSLATDNAFVPYTYGAVDITIETGRYRMFVFQVGYMRFLRGLQVMLS